MQPFSYRDPDKPFRPEDEDPSLMPMSRLRAQTGWGFGAGPRSWRGSIATLAFLGLVLLILLVLISLHIGG